MEKINSYNLSLYDIDRVFVIRKDLLLLAHKDNTISTYCLNRREILNHFPHIKIAYRMFRVYANYILSTEMLRAIDLWNFETGRIIDQFSILREHPSSIDMNDRYITIVDSGYIGCRYYVMKNGKFTEKPRLKFDGEIVIAIKLKEDTLFVTTLDGYIIRKKLSPNYRYKKVKIDSQFLYGFEVTDKYLVVVGTENTIRIIDRNDWAKIRTFKPHQKYACFLQEFEDKIISSSNFMGGKDSEIIVWDPETLEVVCTITCTSCISSFTVKDDLLFIFKKEQSILNLYKHKGFKEQNFIEL